MIGGASTAASAEPSAKGFDQAVTNSKAPPGPEPPGTLITQGVAEAASTEPNAQENKPDQLTDSKNAIPSTTVIANLGSLLSVNSTQAFAVPVVVDETVPAINDVKAPQLKAEGQSKNAQLLGLIQVSDDNITTIETDVSTPSTKVQSDPAVVETVIKGAVTNGAAPEVTVTTGTAGSTSTAKANESGKLDAKAEMPTGVKLPTDSEVPFVQVAVAKDAPVQAQSVLSQPIVAGLAAVSNGDEFKVQRGNGALGGIPRADDKDIPDDPSHDVAGLGDIDTPPKDDPASDVFTQDLASDVFVEDPSRDVDPDPARDDEVTTPVIDATGGKGDKDDRMSAPLSVGRSEAPAAAANGTDARPSAEVRGERLLRVVGQIADRIELLAGARPRNGVTVLLDPKELGAITLNVKTTGGQIEAQIQATDAGVRSALQQNRHMLDHSMQQRGLSLSDMTVSDHSPRSQEDRQNAPSRSPMHAQGRLERETDSATVRILRRSGRDVDMWI